MRGLVSTVVLMALLAAACSDDSDPGATAPTDTSTTSTPADGGDPPETSTTEPKDTASTTAAPTPSSTTSTVLVAPDPETTNTAPSTTQPATVGIPDEDAGVTNEGGVPITLDETAALACANAEFARDSIGFGDLEQAAQDVNAAADRAEPSEQPDIAAAADLIRGALDAPEPLAVVETFLDICVEHGHQI